MRRALVALSLVFVGACGGGAATGGAKAPPPTEAAPPSVMPSTPTMPTSTGTKAEPTLDYGKAKMDFDDADAAFQAAGNDCAQLCKALHSMTHATERLCELTQSGPPADQQRCIDAKSRLEAARAKVTSTCGAC